MLKHLIIVLICADIIKNKKVSRYCAWKQDIVNEGAEFLDKSSAVDKNLITSPHYKYNEELMNLEKSEKSVLSNCKYIFY